MREEPACEGPGRSWLDALAWELARLLLVAGRRLRRTRLVDVGCIACAVAAGRGFGQFLSSGGGSRGGGGGVGGRGWRRQHHARIH